MSEKSEQDREDEATAEREYIEAGNDFDDAGYSLPEEFDDDGECDFTQDDVVT